MRTLILHADADTDAGRAISAAADLLLAGGLVAFPTETVYGLGGLGLAPASLKRIYEAKERPYSDPLILHVSDPSEARPLVRELSPMALSLMESLWPGPLTLVLQKSSLVPDLATAGLHSVALRMPAHPVALELIRSCGSPLAAPSANRFSRPSPTTAAHVLQDLDGRIEAVLDAGPTELGVESTVLDLRSGAPRILRPGGVSREVLERLLGVTLRPEDRSETAPLSAPSPSPGVLVKHYSPRAELVLLEGGETPVREAIRTRAQPGVGVAILAYTEDLPAYEGLSVPVYDLGSRASLEEVAHALYGALREMDDNGMARILVRTAPAGGLGEAINDRLRRAASGKVVLI